MSEEREPIATAYVYEVWSTVELSREQEIDLGKFLGSMAKEGEGGFRGAAVSGVTRVVPIWNFAPGWLKDVRVLDVEGHEKKEESK